MNDHKSKKLLILGGTKKYGEFVELARQLGYYTIVTDWNTPEDSPAKQISDEFWNISLMDYDSLKINIEKEWVTGIITGITDSYLLPYENICRITGLPCYSTKEAFESTIFKDRFKSLCTRFDVPVTPVYSKEDLNNDSSLFPVIVKPADSSGSRGFHICNNLSEFNKFLPIAEEFSPNKNVLIEKFIPWDTVIIHYTAIDGKLYYCGMSDKVSVQFKNTGSSVMGIQTFPSKGEYQYLSSLDAKTRNMFENSGFKNGPIWIEAFYDGNDQFIFNEMGYRFGGSLTYYPVKYFYNIDQLKLLINTAFGLSNSETSHQYSKNKNLKKYCIIPVHIKPGTISHIFISEKLKENKNVYSLVPFHNVGAKIKDWGSAQQVFTYAHLLYDNFTDLKETINFLFHNLTVSNEKGENMVYTLFDFESLN